QAFLKTEFGLDTPGLEPLTGGRVNRLWRCGDWVVKVYDHRHVPRERAERAVQLQTVAATEGLPAPQPLATRSGSLWAESAEGMVVVMPFIRGHRRARGTLNATEATSLGGLLGRLHHALRHLPGEAAPTPPSPAAILTRWECLKAQARSVERPTAFDQVVCDTAEYVAASIMRMTPVDWTAQPWQMCHGDLHIDNILFDDRGAVVGLLDFDNAAPSWPGVEVMMAWNLCLGADPGEPDLSPEAALFFNAYRQANRSAGDLRAALRAYWFTLVSNTWPSAIRYREGTVKAEWTEILSLRYRAARWIEANLERTSTWLESSADPEAV
ncbi:MAG: phosphotransferase, partial [Mycobacterium leprae]